MPAGCGACVRCPSSRPPSACHRVPAARRPQLHAPPTLARPPALRASAGACPAWLRGQVWAASALRADRFSELWLPCRHVGRISGPWVCRASGTMRPSALWVPFRRVLVPGPARRSIRPRVIGHPPPPERVAFPACFRKCFPQCRCEARGQLRTHAAGSAATAFPGHESQHVPHLSSRAPGTLLAGRPPSQASALLLLLSWAPEVFSLCCRRSVEARGHALSVTGVCTWTSHAGPRDNSSYRTPSGL